MLLQNINQLGNTWLKFKNELVLGQKPELIDFFRSLESGIKWLSEHEQEILKIGKGLVEVIKLYAEWRLALLALQIPMVIAGFFAGEQSRLNSVLGVSKEKAIYDNLKLEESELKLNDIEEIGIVKTNQVISAAVKESEAIKEKTVSLDLFTEAQIANIAASEKLRDEWVQMDIFGSGAGAGDAAFLGFGTRATGSTHGLHDRYRYATEDPILAAETEAIALRGNLELNAAATAQASLFAKSELDLAASYGVLNPQIQYQTEMMEANAIAAQQMATAQEANAAAIALQADVLGASNYGNAMANLATMPYAAKNAIGKVPGLISSTVMPVFIAGMAIEVASQLFPSNSVNKESMGLSQVLNTFGSFGFEFWGNGENVQRYAEKIGVNKAFQETLNRNLWSSYGYDVSTGKLTENKLNPNGTGLYDLLVKEQENINKQGIKYDLLGLIDTADDKGNVKTDNASVYSLIKRAGFLLKAFIGDGIDETNPYFPKSLTNTGTPTTNYGDPKISHLRGNSSNYVTISIHEMNGIKGYTAKYDKNGTKIEEEKLSEIVGTTIVKILTGVVNDSQLVGRHH